MSATNGKTRPHVHLTSVTQEHRPLETDELVRATLSHCRDPQQLAEVVGQLQEQLKAWERVRTREHVRRLMRTGQ